MKFTTFVIMGSYIVSARKYRPGTFLSVVGQSHITQTLKSAIVMDQLAHAFLFSGPRGVGKTTCARILAKAINCENLQEDGEPCNACESCVSYNQGKSFNIHELDAASNNSVDDIRNLIEQTRYVPANGKRSVYIIDEVHMLSQAAFNAFLKTLEEPPEHVLFILATTEKHKILPTILSRCQKFDFRRIKVDDIAQHLAYISERENISFEYAALQQIALKADGALRDALSLYDQLVSFSQQELTFQMVLENLNILDYAYYFKAVSLILENDHQSLLLMLNEIIEKGFEAKDFLIGLTEHFRNLLMCKSEKTVELLETSENVQQQYANQSRLTDSTFLVNAFHQCSLAESQIKSTAIPRLAVELTLIKLAHLGSAIEIVEEQLVAEKKNLSVKNKSVPTSSIHPIPADKNQQKKLTKLPETSIAAHESEISINPPVSPKEVSKPDSVSSAGLKNLKKEEKEEKKHISTEKNHSNPSTSEKKESFSQEPPKNKKLAQPEFKLAQNLQEMQQVLKDANDGMPENKNKKVKQAEKIELHISIDRNKFNFTLKKYTDKLKKQDKFTLISILQEAHHEFDHNKWMCKVPNDLAEQWVKKEVDMVPFFRKELGINELFIEILVDKNHVQNSGSQPYTQEEKLKAMAEKNPAIKQLEKLFNARIIYR